MAYGDVQSDVQVVAVEDAPELGARVELVEGTVGDALHLIDQQQAGITGVRFTLEALAISLRVDGRRLTVDEIKALPVKCTNALLLRLGPRALELNRFFPREGGEDEEQEEPETPDPKS